MKYINAKTATSTPATLGGPVERFVKFYTVFIQLFRVVTQPLKANQENKEEADYMCSCFQRGSLFYFVLHFPKQRNLIFPLNREFDVATKFHFWFFNHKIAQINFVELNHYY